MIRHLWLAVSIAAAAVFAAPLYDKLPTLLDMLGTGTLKGGYISLLTADAAVVQAGVILAGLVIATVMGFGILALVEGVLVATCQSRLKRSAAEAMTRGPITESRFRDCFAQAPFLADIAEKYLRRATTTLSAEGKARRGSAETGLIAWAPASDYFGPTPLVDNRLFWSLYGPLPWAALGTGLTLTSIAYVRPGNIGSAEPLTVAAAITSLTFALTTLIFFFTRAVRQARRIQAGRFSADLDGILNLPAQQQQLHDLAVLARTEQSVRQSAQKTLRGAEMDDELRKVIQELAETARKITADQSTQVQQLMRTTLKSFVDDLERQVTGHAKTIDHSLSAAASAAEKMEKSIAETSKTFMKTARTQSQELTAALQKSATALANFEGRSRADLSGELKDLAAKLEAIAASIKPMVEEVKANQMALLETVQGDASSAKAISAAATDMNAAAHASKDALEGFVRLAKELQEAARAFTAGLPETIQAPVQAAPAQPTSTSRTVDKSIREDLHKLQALTASRNLPKL